MAAPYTDSLPASAPRNTTRIGAAHVLFALVMIGLGIIGLIYGDFALVWQRIPIEHLPGQQFFAYACATIELATGIGLLMRPTLRLAAYILFVYLVLWLILLKLPAVVAMPQMEATWLGFGEIAVVLAGGWIVFALHAGALERRYLNFAVGASGVRKARILFALSLPMIGLSHFFYSEQTVAFVPSWLPLPLYWAYLTGAGSIVASIGLLFAIYPRLAATLEAAMLSIITLLVWGPGLITTPTDRTQWTAFVISWAIAGGAWIVADSYRGVPWFAMGGSARKLPIN
ncbi:DoxX family membrane protein [Dyella tabacisoli]|uniref:DoxX family membrane protein n=2 Tax=Dyella tabacisoli TaxID=2282381 RepID=A0A369USM1_9GAMM|nr:DoxX family membrane protein [Dyella tabacisoli]